MKVRVGRSLEMQRQPNARHLLIWKCSWQNHSPLSPTDSLATRPGPDLPEAPEMLSHPSATSRGLGLEEGK